MGLTPGIEPAATNPCRGRKHRRTHWTTEGPNFTNSQVEEIHLKVIPRTQIHKRTQTLTKHLGRTDMIVNNLHLNTDREQTINRQTVNRSCMLINISNIYFTRARTYSHQSLPSPARIGGCRFEPWLETHFYHLSSLARSYFLVFSFMTPLFGSRNIFRPCCNMDSAEMSKFLLISSFV